MRKLSWELSLEIESFTNIPSLGFSPRRRRFSKSKPAKYYWIKKVCSLVSTFSCLSIIMSAKASMSSLSSQSSSRFSIIEYISSKSSRELQTVSHLGSHQSLTFHISGSRQSCWGFFYSTRPRNLPAGRRRQGEKWEERTELQNFYYFSVHSDLLGLCWEERGGGALNIFI